MSFDEWCDCVGGKERAVMSMVLSNQDRSDVFGKYVLSIYLPNFFRNVSLCTLSWKYIFLYLGTISFFTFLAVRLFGQSLITVEKLDNCFLFPVELVCVDFSGVKYFVQLKQHFSALLYFSSLVEIIFIQYYYYHHYHYRLFTSFATCVFQSNLPTHQGLD